MNYGWCPLVCVEAKVNVNIAENKTILMIVGSGMAGEGAGIMHVIIYNLR